MTDQQVKAAKSGFKPRKLKDGDKSGAKKLSKPFVSTNKSYRMFDGGGLYLEVDPNGGKWWRLKYRFDGKEKRISLGVYPAVSLKVARDKRTTFRKNLAGGHRSRRKSEGDEVIAG